MSCPVPDCPVVVPAGCTFCPDHHFRVPRMQTSMITALKFQCSRTEDDDARTHLREQIAAHIHAAVDQLTAARLENAFSDHALAREHARNRRELRGQIRGAHHG